MPSRDRRVQRTVTGTSHAPILRLLRAELADTCDDPVRRDPGHAARNVHDEVLVANIGVPSKELYAARDRPENFYMLGSYTQASAIGLGIATARRINR